MGAPACSDEEFIQLFESLGASHTAQKLGLTEANVYQRRRRVEQRYSITLRSPNKIENRPLPFAIEPLTIEGTAVIFSDAHFWPDVYTDALWLLVHIIREVKPVVIFDNGDSLDGARISRHGRIGWDQRPTLAAELAAVETCKKLIENAAGDAKLYQNWGNHDLRLDTYCSTRAPDLEGVKGTSLKDHLPKWKFQSGVMVNGTCIIKHRFKGGINAGHNNTLWAGLSMVTGHDHRLGITHFSDYRGTRYGVQTGTLADPHGAMFDYTEGAPTNWQPGFVVAYFEGEDHRFEAVEVRNGYARFGGRKWSL